ncbi:sporulation protein Cse60 [uncultured Limosilactobacillus sp.]|uniref:sporulation protein Cse60 n=1 Tax=uncultured Limosilactobacillus sp. TaxID=2837629 RepID=UPI00259422C4|nr:sporulation protein Cse60 [uncultured Limosilactobacillus sp.]
MTKVKFFEANNFYSSKERKFIKEFPEKLEQQINDFIKDKTVIDVKYNRSSNSDVDSYTALVIYEPKKTCNRK